MKMDVFDQKSVTISLIKYNSKMLSPKFPSPMVFKSASGFFGGSNC